MPILNHFAKVCLCQYILTHCQSNWNPAYINDATNIWVALPDHFCWLWKHRMHFPMWLILSMGVPGFWYIFSIRWDRPLKEQWMACQTVNSIFYILYTQNTLYNSHSPLTLYFPVLYECTVQSTLTANAMLTIQNDTTVCNCSNLPYFHVHSVYLLLQILSNLLLLQHINEDDCRETHNTKWEF